VLAIVTPTYNRAELLPKLYDSLLNQTDFSFRWYIIDDGSTDNTEAVCKSFLSDQFDILYLKKENGGKHTALNFSYKFIQEDVTIIVDSDDYLACDAVETICKDWEKYKSCDDVGGMSYYKLLFTGQVIGDTFHQNYYISSYIQYIINEKIRGDKAEVFRSSVLKENPFPVFENEKFLSEAVIWIKMSLKYKMIYIQKGIYYCEYLQDGLTMSGRRKLVKNPLGYVEHAKAYLSDGIKQAIQYKYTLMYIAASMFAKIPFKTMYRQCKRKCKFIVCLPFGMLLYVYWKLRYDH
jgi:glycosyltransferase involved in cell wall biosynthesis